MTAQLVDEQPDVDPSPARPSPAFATCRTCSSYARRRALVVAPFVRARALERGADPSVAMALFIHGVHRRHTTGLSIATPGVIG